jgi:hypothetical protein
MVNDENPKKMPILSLKNRAMRSMKLSYSFMVGPMINHVGTRNLSGSQKAFVVFGSRFPIVVSSSTEGGELIFQNWLS